MDIRCKTRSGLLALACASAFAFVWPAALSAQAIPRPELKVGDTWTYHVTNRPTFGNPATTKREVTQTVQEVLGDGYRIVTTGTEATGTPAAPGTFEFTTDLNPRSRAAEGRGWREFKRLQWPLEPGKTWKFEFEQVDPSTPSVWSGKADDWTEFSVPAGRFRAIKVVLTRESLGASAATVRETFWYSPEAKRGLRLESYRVNKGYVYEDVIWELVKFDVK